MGAFVWKEDYALGIDVIDQQHRGLIRMIDDLQAALAAERGQQVLTQIVGRMLEYAVSHFSTEEALLTANGYPGYWQHKQEHDAFAAKARELKQRLDGQHFVLSLEVINFLKSWLDTHILVNDKNCAQFLSGTKVR